MTYLQVVNQVLRRLREETVTAYTDTDYSTLIGDFVNDTIQEVQHAWEWNALHEEITIATTGAAEYDITGTTETTRIITVYDDTNDFELIRKPREWISKQKHFTTDSGQTTYYRETGTSAAGLRQVEFWPTPPSGDSYIYSVYNPQDRISADATVIKVPTNPVIFGAWWRAIEERGEDGGGQSTSILRQYNRYLQDAIILDSERRERLSLDWIPV